MADIKLPALSPQDVLPRGENLCKYYILEGIYYLHLLQDPKQTDDLVNRVIELSQQLNVTFQGRNVESLGTLMSETLRKLILVLKTTSVTNEVNKAVQILYNRPINLKLHQIASLLGKGAQEMWKTIKSRDNRSNPVDILYSQNINDCQVAINEKKKNRDISIEDYLNKVLVPNIENIVANSSDIIKVVNSTGVENITLDNIYEVHMLCAGQTGGQPIPIVMKVSGHLTNIMAGFFNIVSVVGFRLLAKLSYTAGVQRAVKMERMKYEAGRFLFKDSETYQKYKQDIREANRQLGRSITGLAGGLISPFYSAIKSHPLGRLLVNMGEFGFKQAYLRTGRFFGAGYKKSGFRDYYETRIPSAFDTEEAWSSFGSKTRTDHMLDYERGQAFKQLQKLLKDNTKNAEYDEDSNVNKLLTQPKLNDAVIQYNNLLLKGVDKLNDKERDALERYKDTISRATGLRDEGAIRKFVELYLRYRSYQGLASMRNTRNESNTAFYSPPNRPGSGTTSYTTGQRPAVSGSALPTIPSITQPDVSSEPPEQASTPPNANVQQSGSVLPKPTSWRQAVMQLLQTQPSGASGSEPQQEPQATAETPSSEIQDFANKLANAITRSLPQNLSAAIPLIASAVTEVVQSNIAKTKERLEAGVQQHDLSTTKKEIKTELLDKICDVINCVNKNMNRSTTSPEELDKLLKAIEKQEQEISEMAELVVDTVSGKGKSSKGTGVSSSGSVATGGAASGSRSGSKQPAAGSGATKQQTPQVSPPATPSSVSSTVPSVQNVSSAASSPSTPKPSAAPQQKQKSPAKTQVRKKTPSAPSSGRGAPAQSKRMPVKKGGIRSRMAGYLASKAKPTLGKRAGAAVATEGLAGLAGGEGVGGALSTLMGGGRMLGMLANPLGIALGVGLLGLAGYGGYKILTKAILPQIQGKGFSLVEDKRRETIDSIIAKMGSPDDETKKKLAEARQKLGEGIRVNLVSGGARNLARDVRVTNAASIQLTGRPASRGGNLAETVNVEPTTVLPPVQPLPTQQTPQQVSPEQQEKTEQQKQRAAQIVGSQQYQAEAQQRAQEYNQAMINEAIQSNNTQMVRVLKAQSDLLQGVVETLNQLKQQMNSNPSPITGP
jgi:hypothetical protein